MTNPTAPRLVLDKEPRLFQHHGIPWSDARNDNMQLVQAAYRTIRQDVDGVMKAVQVGLNPYTSKRSKLVTYSQGYNGICVTMQALVYLCPGLVADTISPDHFELIPVTNGDLTKLVFHEVPGYTVQTMGGTNRMMSSIAVAAINSIEAFMMNLLGRQADKPSSLPIGRIELSPEWRGYNAMQRRPRTWGAARARVEMVVDKHLDRHRTIPPTFSADEERVIAAWTAAYDVDHACVKVVRASIGAIPWETVPFYGCCGKPDSFIRNGAVEVRRPVGVTPHEWNDYLCAPCELPNSVLDGNVVVLDPHMAHVEGFYRDLTLLEKTFQHALNNFNLGCLTPGVALGYLIQKVYFRSRMSKVDWTTRGLPYDYDVPDDILAFVFPLVDKDVPAEAPLENMILGMKSLYVASDTAKTASTAAPVAAGPAHAASVYHGAVDQEVTNWLHAQSTILDLGETARRVRLAAQPWYPIPPAP